MKHMKLKCCWPYFVLALIAVGLVNAPNTACAGELSVENVAGAETINVKKAKKLFDAGALFVDSRSKAAFNTGRISGAESIPLSKKPTAADFIVVKETLKKMASYNEPVIMYCNGVKCPLSAAMAIKALEWGYKEIYYFRDGYPAWKKAGYTVE